MCMWVGLSILHCIDLCISVFYIYVCVFYVYISICLYMCMWVYTCMLYFSVAQELWNISPHVSVPRQHTRHAKHQIKIFTCVPTPSPLIAITQGRHLSLHHPLNTGQNPVNELTRPRTAETAAGPSKPSISQPFTSGAPAVEILTITPPVVLPATPPKRTSLPRWYILHTPEASMTVIPPPSEAVSTRLIARQLWSHLESYPEAKRNPSGRLSVRRTQLPVLTLLLLLHVYCRTNYPLRPVSPPPGGPGNTSAKRATPRLLLGLTSRPSCSARPISYRTRMFRYGSGRYSPP